VSRIRQARPDAADSPARVAYLILSYVGHVERLVATLRAGSPDALIAVHHDARIRPLGDVDALRIAPRPIAWGHGSQLLAVLHGLRELRDRADWFVLLSGQDYPLRPLAQIEAGLRGADAFIQAAPVPPLTWRRGAADEFARRYRMRWRPVAPGVARLAAKADPLAHVRTLPGGTSLGLRARPPLPPFHGSDWFTLSRAAVDAVLDAPRALLDHFLHTIVPTEAYVHTVLANSSLRLHDGNRRHVRFDAGSPNPRVLTLADVDAALASGADFARKFDDPAVLDELDRRLTSELR
jgi:hypothetical protein